MIFDGRILISAIMLAIFAGMVGYAATFPADARLLPWVIGIPGLLLCLAQLVSELRSRPAGPAVDPAARRREFVMLAWMAAFILGVLLFGFLVAGPVLVAAYLFIDWRERPALVIASAAICWAILYFVFERALHMDLFDGLVIGWLSG